MNKLILRFSIQLVLFFISGLKSNSNFTIANNLLSDYKRRSVGTHSVFKQSSPFFVCWKGCVFEW